MTKKEFQMKNKHLKKNPEQPKSQIWVYLKINAIKKIVKSEKMQLNGI